MMNTVKQYFFSKSSFQFTMNWSCFGSNKKRVHYKNGTITPTYIILGLLLFPFTIYA